MYASPAMRRGSPRRKQIPEGPIHDFWTVIESTPADVWQKRTAALTALVNLVPEGADYSLTTTWYNSPPVLRHLAIPLAELIKDPRSTVVKRTCSSLSELFAKCQTDARYLLKDLMSTILGVHAQTVAVIRVTVQEMVVDTLAVVPCKMSMPLWLDRLKSDKSRTVREACALYLGVGLQEWTDPGYLTPEIWNQVASSLVRALRDQAPPVRRNAKKGLEIIQACQPNILTAILQEGTLTRDARAKRLLERIQSGEAAGDDVSVASSRIGGASVVSNRSYSAFGGNRSISGRELSMPSPSNYGNRPSQRGSGSFERRGRDQERESEPAAGIPKNIAVSTGETPPPRISKLGVVSRGGLGPPIRMSNLAAATSTSAPVAVSPPALAGANAGPFRAAVESPVRPNLKTSAANDIAMTSTGSFDTIEVPDLPVIASKAELIEHAAKRRNNSRRSSMLQERFSRSSSHLNSAQPPSSVSNASSQPETDANMLDDLLDSEDTLVAGVSQIKISDDAPQNGSTLPTTSTSQGQQDSSHEHWGIANEILEAHKHHVDQIMETLKIEMDALKDFEQILLDDTDRPTEDGVLDYFESVALCLDQRTTAGNILRRALDRISKGPKES